MSAELVSEAGMQVSELAIMRSTVDTLLREYVSGGGLNALAKLQEALPMYVDDVTRDFGSDLYEKMLQDEDVASAFNVIVDAVMADGASIQPAFQAPKSGKVSREDAVKAAQAAEYARFVAAALDEYMEPNAYDFVTEMLDGLAYGNKVAEKVFQYLEAGPDKGRLAYRTIKTRRREAYAFITDAWKNVLGFLVAEPGQAILLLGGLTALLDATKLPNFLPRDKFVVFSWNPANGDPRGRSILRPVYRPWFLKTQVLPDYYMYLRRFGRPKVVGKTAPLGPQVVVKLDDNGNAVTNPDGSTVEITAQEAMMTAITRLADGYDTAAVPNGAEIDLLYASGTASDAFTAANDYFGRQIHLGILRTARTAKEALHSSKADSGSAQDLTGTFVIRVKHVVEGVINRDVIRPLIRLNYGESALALCPTFSLSKTERRDRVAWLAVCIDAWQAGLLQPEQINDVFAEVGLPEIDIQDLMDKLQAKADAEAQQATMLGSLINPGKSVKDAETEGGSQQ